MTTTAWGTATVVEEVSIKQSATGVDGEKKEFESLVQLLEDGDGKSLIRFAYSTDGATRRGPVTLRAPDLEKLKKGLAKAPRLKATLEASLRH